MKQVLWVPFLRNVQAFYGAQASMSSPAAWHFGRAGSHVAPAWNALALGREDGGLVGSTTRKTASTTHPERQTPGSKRGA